MKRYNEFWKSFLVYYEYYEFRKSFLFYLPTGGAISYCVYSGNLLSAIIVGYIGALNIFFIPLLFKKRLKKQ